MKKKSATPERAADYNTTKIVIKTFKTIFLMLFILLLLNLLINTAL